MLEVLCWCAEVYMASKCVFSSILKMDWNVVSVLIVINLSLVAVGFGWGFCSLFPEKLKIQHCQCVLSLVCYLLFITLGSEIP